MVHTPLKSPQFTLLFFLLFLTSSSFANPFEGKIIPGKSIGKLELGMTSLQIKKMLGFPSIEQSVGNSEVMLWFVSYSSCSDFGDQVCNEVTDALDDEGMTTIQEGYERTTNSAWGRIVIHFEQNKVTYIETNESDGIEFQGQGEATHTGVTLSTPQAEWIGPVSRLVEVKQHYPNLSTRSYREEDSEEGRINVYYDDIKEGITFMVRPLVNQYFNHWTRIDSVGIFKKGSTPPNLPFGHFTKSIYEKEYLGEFGADFDPTSIIPGKSFGLIELGMTRKRISEILLEAPIIESSNPQGYDISVWTIQPDVVWNKAALTIVYFKDNKAFYIESSIDGKPDFGVLSDALRKYPDLIVNAYRVTDSEAYEEVFLFSDKDIYIYDDIPAGISFTVEAESYFDHSHYISRIGVHAPKQKAPIPIASSITRPIYNKPPR